MKRTFIILACCLCVDPSFAASAATVETTVAPVDTTVGPSMCTAEERLVWSGNSEFTTFMTRCSYTAFGRPVLTAECIVSKYTTISLPCATCCGKASECARDKCMFQCFSNNGSPSCCACIETNCTPAFRTCTGAPTDDQLPPVPANVARQTVQPPPTPPTSPTDSDGDSDDDSDDGSDDSK